MDLTRGWVTPAWRDFSTYSVVWRKLTGGESAHVAVLFGHNIKSVKGFTVDEAVAASTVISTSDLTHEAVKMSESFFDSCFAFAFRRTACV